MIAVTVESTIRTSPPPAITTCSLLGPCAVIVSSTTGAAPSPPFTAHDASPPPGARMSSDGATMAEADRRNKERELANLTRDFQRNERTFREDLNQRKNEELASLQERANKIIQQAQAQLAQAQAALTGSSLMTSRRTSSKPAPSRSPAMRSLTRCTSSAVAFGFRGRTVNAIVPPALIDAATLRRTRTGSPRNW